MTDYGQLIAESRRKREQAEDEQIVRQLATEILTEITTPDFTRALSIHLVNETAPKETRVRQARGALAVVYGAIVTGDAPDLWEAGGRRLFSLAASVAKLEAGLLHGPNGPIT